MPTEDLVHQRKNYPIHKLEFLTFKWAVTEKYDDYLYGNTFTVLTDNNPYLHQPKLDATGHRWIAAMASCNCSIMYRPGSSNADADGQSKLPGLLGKNNVSNISTESVKAICNNMFSPMYSVFHCLSQQLMKHLCQTDT
jgi:hypothetical protein